MLRSLLGLSAAGLTLLIWAAVPTPASACGGFFCDNSAPVVQQAERIIFSKNADGTVTAIVQIQYTGPSERFAWVLPVPGTPTVGVSSNQVFNSLGPATAPNYVMTTRTVGICRQPDYSGADAGADASGFVDGSTGFDSGAPPVTVLDEGSVGPFDWVLISLNAAAVDPADAAVTWLMDNSFDVAPSGRDLLGPYLADGMNLIAFRLSKQATAGEIQPIRLTYDAPCAMIPIKLTAVATQPDMPVLVWVLGQGRAVPTNYLSLQINDALINWYSPMSNYDAVVGAAADEAGGQGFVTEMSGLTASLPSALTSAQDGWPAAMRVDSASSDAEVIAGAVFLYPGWDGLTRVARDHVPLAAGQTGAQALTCIQCEVSGGFCGGFCPVGGQDLTGFDRAAFIDAVESEVITPVREGQALLRSRPNITRLYTNLSAPEMTLDPSFDFNPSLPSVSRTHRARRVIECTPAVYRWEAPSHVTLPDGREVRIAAGTGWPFTPRASMPATSTIERLAVSGGPVTVRDNSAEIDRVLAAHNAGVPAPPTTLPDAGMVDSGDGGDGGDADGGMDAGAYPPDYSEGGCSIARDSSSHLFAGLSPLVLVLLWRRRRGAGRRRSPRRS